MTDAEHISDEMLTRWLCGQSTPDEEAAVLDYLAESDEHLDGLLTVSASVRLTEEAKPVSRVKHLWPTVSVAASVALLLGIGIGLWNQSSGSSPGMDAAPAYGELDSIVEPNMEECL
jgi:hypothetical protein